MSSHESRVLNYISRYAPSKNKILTYLDKIWVAQKEYFLLSIWYDESMMGDMWMRTFLALSKGEHEIIQKMIKKGFPKDFVLEKIQWFQGEFRSWEDHKSRIISKIESLRERSKSKRIIAMTLTSAYPYFRDEIVWLIEELDERSILEKEVQKYKNRYNLDDFSEKQKFFRALQSRWFQYRDIKNAIEVIPN